MFAVSVFAVFVNFVVRSAAYFELARFRRLKFGFLAFVPVLQYFILGRVCDDLNSKNGFQTSNSFWLVFFSLGFCVPSAVSYVFPKLPLFTFSVTSPQAYILNCVLFLFNFFYIYFYVDCLRVVLGCKGTIFKSLLLAVLVFFVVVGLDFLASLFLFGAILNLALSEKSRV